MLEPLYLLDYYCGLNICVPLYSTQIHMLKP